VIRFIIQNHHYCFVSVNFAFAAFAAFAAIAHKMNAFGMISLAG